MPLLIPNMGKRGDARPDVSDKILDQVAAARAALGKARPQPKRPQATPARSTTSGPTTLDAPATSASQASPMSTKSTPLRSPDLKRLKSVDTEGSFQSIPSLPSYLTTKSGSGHNPDSSSTLGLSQLGRLNLGGLNQCMLGNANGTSEN